MQQHSTAAAFRLIAPAYSITVPSRPSSTTLAAPNVLLSFQFVLVFQFLLYRMSFMEVNYADHRKFLERDRQQPC
jgi:uncharacterized membrane protein